MEFDEAYRLAHLPLVAPDHPSVITSDPGKGYEMGQHEPVYSIAIPSLNLGRLYLRIYPEMRNGVNLCHAIQRAFGMQTTDLYVVGVFNFTEELDATEAATLNAMIKRWWDREIVQLDVRKLWLIKSRDDLVLNGRIDDVIALL